MICSWFFFWRWKTPVFTISEQYPFPLLHDTLCKPCNTCEDSKNTHRVQPTLPSLLPAGKTRAEGSKKGGKKGGTAEAGTWKGQFFILEKMNVATQLSLAVVRLEWKVGLVYFLDFFFQLCVLNIAEMFKPIKMKLNVRISPICKILVMRKYSCFSKQREAQEDWAFYLSPCFPGEV